MSMSVRNRLPGTIEKIVSDKVVSEVVIRTAAGIAYLDYDNWFGGTNESEKTQQRFRRDGGDLVSVEKDSHQV